MELNESDDATPSIWGLSGRTLVSLAACVVFSALFYFNAYLCDDAFLAFRSADNLVRGYGFRFDVADRVQVFTAPLFLCLFSAIYWVAHDPEWLPNPDRVYWSAMGLSYALSLATVLLVVRSRAGATVGFGAFLLLMSSQAFVTFTSSGLETPLIFLLLVVFYRRYLWTTPEAPGDFFWLLFVAALSVVNRMDTMLLLLPASIHLVIVGARLLHGRFVSVVLMGSLPLVGWFAFSVVYFGSLLPNTYFAKTGIEIPMSVVVKMARAYFELGLAQDPVTLWTIAAAGVLACFGKKMFLAWVGAASYILYVGSVGGDFLGFRFLAAPFLVSVLVIARFLTYFFDVPVNKQRSLLLAGAAAAFLAYGTFVTGSPLRVFRDGPNARDVRFYFEASRLSNWKPGLDFPFAPFKQVGLEDCTAARADRTVVRVVGGGFLAFCGGPNMHMVLRVGITDALLARLPLSADRPFMPAHLPKALPAGYLESVRAGENRIEDPRLSRYYDKIILLTRADYTDPDRWRAIVALNFTRERRYRGDYVASDPRYTDGFKYRSPSQIEALRRYRRRR